MCAVQGFYNKTTAPVSLTVFMWLFLFPSFEFKMKSREFLLFFYTCLAPPPHITVDYFFFFLCVCVCLLVSSFPFFFNFYKYMKNIQRHPKIRDILGVRGLSIWYIAILFKICNILLNYPSFYSWFLWQIQVILLMQGYLWGHTFVLTTLSKIL